MSNRLSARVEITRENDQWTMVLSGHWLLTVEIKGRKPLNEFFPPACRKLAFNCDELKEWDSQLLLLLDRVKSYCSRQNIVIDETGLPSGVRRLMALSSAVASTKLPETDEPSFLERVAASAHELFTYCKTLCSFTGELVYSYSRLFTGRAQYLRSDFVAFVYETGPAALPIVSLISILVGIILAFVGAVQLEMFGAEIYIADLVGLGMTREMGAMMAAVIMAGRTGAAFAAQLGTMQVNEEIDALQTMGLNPIDFLVLPRMTALILMMPLLTIWADLLGILGGFVIACLTLDISLTEYYEQTLAAVKINHISVGLIKGVIFGYLVAFAGCLKGIQCGRSASAVGGAATSAVVTAIVFIVMSDAFFTYIFDLIGI
ncbi:MAG: ABC transporter permease [Thermodesulfobacteriota bacterium]